MGDTYHRSHKDVSVIHKKLMSRSDYKEKDEVEIECPVLALGKLGFSLSNDFL